MSPLPENTVTLVYAGDVSPGEAWQLLGSIERAALVDVRTTAEWQYVGLPDLRPLGKEPVLLNWQVFPGMEVHQHFVDDLVAKGLTPDQTLLFLCRSGVRSRAAAAAMCAAGYPKCYNVAEGFEGDKDRHSHRGQVGGWKRRGLPWTQS